MTALLTDNLLLLAGAPNGIKKLRELILELAVRGKLVPQNPSDEPASELLKRIAEEKTRLLAQGTIKKQKPLASISEDEAPFKIPSGWQWVRLGEIAEIIRGVTYGKSDASDSPQPGYTPLLRGNNINRVLNFDRPVFVPQKLIADNQYIQAGDIVIAMSSGSADLVGKAAQAETNFDGAFGAFCGVVRSRTPALFSFFGFFFQTPLYRVRAAGHGKGIGINNLQKTVLETLEVPLPPLPEQYRIVTKVDELMALCDRLEAQQADAESAHALLVQALLNSLTQASGATDFAANWQRLAEHFHTLFTTEPSIDALQQSLLQLAVMGKLAPQDPNDEPASEWLGKIVSDRQKLADEGVLKKQRNLTEVSEEEKLFTIPQGWIWARISSFSELKSGLAYKSEAFNETGDNQVIRMGNIRPNMLRLETNPVFISNDLARDTSDFSLIAGDIVLTMTGTKGKQDYMYSVLIEEEHLEKNRLYLNQRLCTVRTKAINPKFLLLILQDKRLLDPIFRSSTGTANQANIGMSILNNWALPIPPIAEQNRIMDATDKFMSICETLKTKIKKSYQIHDLISSTLIAEGLA